MVRARGGPRSHSLARRRGPADTTATVAATIQQELLRCLTPDNVDCLLDTPGGLLPAERRHSACPVRRRGISAGSRETLPGMPPSERWISPAALAFLIAFSPVFLCRVGPREAHVERDPCFSGSSASERPAGRSDAQVPHHARERRPQDSSAVRREFHPVQRQA